MKKVSKNITLGEPIADIRELAQLANEKKSVIWSPKFGYYFVRPSAFFLGWPLREVINAKLFYSIKTNETK